MRKERKKKTREREGKPKCKDLSCL